MKPLKSFIPTDRLQALVKHTSLPEHVYGTALFADISGFTPLTEALLKAYGRRVGPEELTRQLNTIYEALIAEVQRYGGSIISFSGDAITCWFDDDPGPRAATCALEMQAAMEQLTRSPITAGPEAPLAVKIALAAGPARRFLVGDPDIQLLDTLAGSTLLRMSAAEKVAGKGEVIIGSEIKAQLGAAAQTVERRLADRPQVYYVLTGLRERAIATPWPDTSALTLSAEELRPWLLRPVYDRLCHSSAQFLAESRAAIALFLKFGEIDYDHAVDAGQTLDAFMRWTQHVVDQHGGHLIQLTIGDKASYLYATFGALVAHDDDAQRALAAARQLISPPQELSSISQVQIGLSQGRMFAGIYGSSTHCTFGVLGDDVNLAARLMSLARPGQILVSKRLFESAIGSYHFQSLGQIQIKGKTALQPAYLVTSEHTALSGKQLTPLIGREHELDQIDRLLQAALAGQGGTLRISGVAGIGKSRLKAVLIERAVTQHVMVAQGVCHSSTQQTSYSPWRQILKALFVADQDLPVAWNATQELAQIEQCVTELDERWLERLPLLSELLGLAIPDTTTTRTLEAPQRQAMLFDFVLDLLGSWARRQPRVIVLEDIQWLDEASQQLTLTLARAVADKPILFAVVHRDDRPVLAELDQTAHYHTIALAPLSDAALHTLVTQRLQGQIDPLVIDLVQRRTQGNPLFIEQLVEALADSAKLVRSEEGQWSLADSVLTALLSAGCLEKREGEWGLTETAALAAADLDIPDTLQALVQSRLDRLSADHKLTLKVASVIGEEFSLDLLERSHPARLDQAQLEEHVHLFAAHDLLRPTALLPQSLYSFAHPVLQEVTYASVPDEQRRLIHGAVGSALETLQPERVEQLAHHYDRSDFDEKAVFYLDQAARSAQRKGVNRTALGYFTRALRRADQWEWRKGKVEAWHNLGERDEELLELRALDVVAGVPPSETARLWSDYYEATGDYPQAQAYIERASIEYEQRADALGKARCLNQLGAIAARQGEFDHAREWYSQALDVVADRGNRSAEEPLVVLRTLNGLGIAACQQGHYAESKLHFEHALELSRLQGNRLDEAQALNNLGMLAAYQRDFDRAQHYHREALEIRRVIGHRAGEGLSAYNLAVAYVEAGSYAEAETYFKAALSIARALGNRWDEVNVLNGLGVLYLLVGVLPQAQAHLQNALKVAQSIGDEAGQAYTLCNLGQVTRDTGHLALASQLLTQGLNLAQVQNDIRLVSICLGHLSTVSLRAGEIDQAINQANRALTMHREIGLELWTTTDLVTLASAKLMTDEIVAALGYAEQAKSILDAHDGAGAEFPHRDYYICYQVFLAAGQVEHALAALQSAHRLVMRVRAKITDAGMRESFSAIPVNREIANEYRQHGPDATQRTGNG